MVVVAAAVVADQEVEIEDRAVEAGEPLPQPLLLQPLHQARPQHRHRLLQLDVKLRQALVSACNYGECYVNILE